MRRFKLIPILATASWLFGGSLFAADTNQAPVLVHTIEQRVKTANHKAAVITAMTMAMDRELLAAAGDDHVIRLWNPATAQLVAEIPGHLDWIRSLAFSPDGTMLASAGDDRRIIFWKADGVKWLRARELPPHGGAIYAMCYSPDGKTLAAVGFEHQVHIYDAASGSERHSLTGPCGDLRAVTISPDSKYVAAAGRNGQIRIWDLASGSMSLEIAAGVERLRALAYSPDGKLIAATGEARIVQVWNARDGEPVCDFRCSGAKLYALTFFGPDTLAAGGSDNLIHGWNLVSRQCSFELKGHLGSIAALATDGTGTTMVSSGFDTTLCVWRLSAGPGGTAQRKEIEPKIR